VRKKKEMKGRKVKMWNHMRKRNEMKRRKMIKWNHMSNILPQILSKVLDINMSGNIRLLGGRIFLWEI